LSKKVLLTGAGGFVGSHVLRHILVNKDWEIYCPVTFRHHGRVSRVIDAIESQYHDRLHFFIWDLKTPFSTLDIVNNGIESIDYILNVASQSHVDRSIESPQPFIMNNVYLMVNLLEYARKVKPEVFLHMSTDEVFGPAPEGYAHQEWDSIIPSNPYSASKAAQESIGISYWRTYDVPLIITNTMNIIGERQDPEKFIPNTIRKAISGQDILVHGSPQGKPGSRFYIHARNFADAWLHILDNVKPAMYGNGSDRPERFNIVGEKEIDNLYMAQAICELVEDYTTGVPVSSSIDLVDFHSSRPGHDLRYALDGSKLQSIGWEPPIHILDSLANVVRWYVDNPEWLV
jgi:dTDP-glucose 4,6-dehydratase